jgi:hypothetical protein
LAISNNDDAKQSSFEIYIENTAVPETLSGDQLNTTHISGFNLNNNNNEESFDSPQSQKQFVQEETFDSPQFGKVNTFEDYRSQSIINDEFQISDSEESEIELVLLEELPKIPQTIRTPSKIKVSLHEFNKHMLEVAEDQARKRRHEEQQDRQIEQQEKRKKRDDKRISFRKSVDDQLLIDQLASKEQEEKEKEGDDLLAELGISIDLNPHSPNDDGSNEDIKKPSANLIELSDDSDEDMNVESVPDSQEYDVDSDGYFY